MDMELLFASGGCAVLATGHAVIGRHWVLPALKRAHFPATPFGPPSLTLGMQQFTWHVVTIVLAAFAVLLAALAVARPDSVTLVLRWCAAFWLADTVLGCWNARRRPRLLVRFPVPAVTLVVAVLCWTATT